MAYRITKFKLLITAVLGVLYLGYGSHNGKSLSLNKSACKNLYKHIYKSLKKKNLKLISLNNEFDIN